MALNCFALLSSQNTRYLFNYIILNVGTRKTLLPGITNLIEGTEKMKAVSTVSLFN